MIPAWLRYKKGENERSPVWFIDLRGTGFSPESPLWQKRVNAEIESILEKVKTSDWKEPVLIKCHISERRCRTRMLPEYCMSTVNFFRHHGMNRMVTGDTTVVYTGDRGYHENNGDCNRYLKLAERHHWTEKGPLGIPFVILDKPYTSVKETFSFNVEEVNIKPRESHLFRDAYISGGFAEAGTIVNHVHLTLHDMAQVACAVKGITMGGSSYKGKLIMHKCYSPEINNQLCKRCGTCAKKCPEKALEWEKDRVPLLINDRCIGCGECIAVCPHNSISMVSRDIEDWLRGGESLPYRMSDYIMGIMEDRWDRLINIVHLYNITRRCDCVDKAQKPITPHIGFLVGRNSFAVDLMATYLLHEELYKEVKAGRIKGRKELTKTDILQIFFAEYHGLEPYRYIQQEYDIVVEPEPVRIMLH